VRMLVYVEGHSDRLALAAILRPLIELGRRNRVGISFHALDGKEKVLNECAQKAARHLADAPDDWIFALPDLYPLAASGSRNAHQSFLDLERLLRARFEQHAKKGGLRPAIYTHFRVHCLKHDLEALLLAAPDALRKRLRTQDVLRDAWKKPVEDQNGDRPPKRIVEQLFEKYRKKARYDDVMDATLDPKPRLAARRSHRLSATLRAIRGGVAHGRRRRRSS
jgi:hypothetical protein